MDSAPLNRDAPNTWPDVLSPVGENLRFEDKHLLRRAEPQTRIATTASSANQLTSKMTIALGIKFFFMAISRNFGLALAFMWVGLPQRDKGLRDSHHVLRKRDRA